jgi:hypothetical protein
MVILYGVFSCLSIHLYVEVGVRYLNANVYGVSSNVVLKIFTACE